MLSIYQQNIRGKGIETISSMIDHADKLHQYDYLTIINRWKTTFPKAKFSIRPYGHLLNGDIIQDFLNIIECPLSDKEIEANYAAKNLSFDATSIELIRIFNLLESNNQLILPHQTKRHLRKSLKNKKRGQKFSLSPEDQKKIWETFRDDNLALCAKHDLTDCIEYFSALPKANPQVFYNEDVVKDDLYHLFFRIFQP